MVNTKNFYQRIFFFFKFLTLHTKEPLNVHEDKISGQILTNTTDILNILPKRPKKQPQLLLTNMYWYTCPKTTKEAKEIEAALVSLLMLTLNKVFAQFSSLPLQSSKTLTCSNKMEVSSQEHNKNFPSLLNCKRLIASPCTSTDLQSIISLLFASSVITWTCIRFKVKIFKVCSLILKIKNFKINSITMREKCRNTELFLVHTFLYSHWAQENTDQKKLRIWTVFKQC